MRVFAFLLLGLLFLVTQSTFFQSSPEWLGNPDLLYILIAFVAYRFDWFRGLCLAFSYGWMMDVASGTFLGTYPLLYLSVFPLLKLLARKNPLKETAYQIPLVGVSYFATQFALYFVFSLVQPDSLPELFWGNILQDALILTLATIPTFLLCNSLFEYLGQKRSLTSRIGHRAFRGNRFRS